MTVLVLVGMGSCVRCVLGGSGLIIIVLIVTSSMLRGLSVRVVSVRRVVVCGGLGVGILALWRVARLGIGLAMVVVFEVV